MKENMLVVLHNEKELGEDEILRYISQVTEGMEYVHQQSILHCDLAARNISLVYVCMCVYTRRLCYCRSVSTIISDMFNGAL